MRAARRSGRRRRIHVYGWRQVTVILPRIWRWSLNVTVWPLPPRVVVGIFAGADEDGDWNVSMGVGVVEVTVVPVRMLTRRERRERLDAYVAERSGLLVSEIEDHLGGRS